MTAAPTSHPAYRPPARASATPRYLRWVGISTVAVLLRQIQSSDFRPSVPASCRGRPHPQAPRTGSRRPRRRLRPAAPRSMTSEAAPVSSPPKSMSSAPASSISASNERSISLVARGNACSGEQRVIGRNLLPHDHDLVPLAAFAVADSDAFNLLAASINASRLPHTK